MSEEVDFTKDIEEEVFNTSILGEPESKTDKVLYFLFDNGSQTAEKLIEISEMSEGSFYNFKNKNKESIFVKNKDGKTSYYDITDMYRNYVEGLIKTKKESLELKQKIDEESSKLSQEREEYLQEAKNFIENNRDKISVSTESIVIIDFNDIVEYSPTLSDSIVEKPEETIQNLEIAIEELGISDRVRVRLKNLSNIFERRIETIRSNDLQNLITIKGRVMQLSDIRPQIVKAKFECPSCGTIISVLQVEKKFREPTRCSCGRRGGFNVVSKEMIDTARIVLEDLHDKSDNPLSKRINCFIKEDLVNKENIKKCFPGNEIIVTGVLKEVPTPLPSGGVSTRMELAIEVNNVELSEDELNMNIFSDEEITEFKELSSRIDLNGLSEINKSFCADVYGNEKIKNAIILFLANKRNEKNKNKIRNKSNILLIGDPGTAKSVMCNKAVSITPSSRKQTGGSASAVGLTASAVRDDYSGGWALQPGALVLAKEFTFIDELNNLGDEEKPKLQEAMSEQEINIAKASIQATLSVTGGILSCANPRNGIFDKDVQVTKQFNIPPAILNRFDLVYVLTDNVDSDCDRKISKAMIRRHRGMIKQNYNDDFLKKFLFYIRNFDTPELTDEIEEKMIKLYERARKFKGEGRYINARLQESLIRMSIASAKLRMSKTIEEKDLERAMDTLSASYYMLPEYKNIEEFDRKIVQEKI